MLSVAYKRSLLSVIMLNVVMLSVMAPQKEFVIAKHSSFFMSKASETEQKKI